MPQRAKNLTNLKRVQPAPGPPAFTRFTLLPQEIQDMIWKDAINSIGQRVVEVQEGTHIKTRRGNHLRKRQFTSTCPIPSVLHACQNSRKLALGRWYLSFGTNDQPARIFFDFSSDTLYFGESFGNIAEFTERVHTDDLERIHRVAFHLQQQRDNDYYDYGGSLSHIIQMDFPNLTHIVLPVMDYDFRWDLAAMDLPQPVLDPRKTVVTFYEGDQDDMIWELEDIETLNDFIETREIWGWSRIGIAFANFRRSIPDSLEEEEDQFFGCECHGREEECDCMTRESTCWYHRSLYMLFRGHR